MRVPLERTHTARIVQHSRISQYFGISGRRFFQSSSAQADLVAVNFRQLASGVLNEDLHLTCQKMTKNQMFFLLRKRRIELTISITPMIAATATRANCCSVMENEDTEFPIAVVVFPGGGA